MGTVQKDSVVKNVLKNLCCSYGWSYGAFWSYSQPNSMLLTLQDAYFEEKIGSLIASLLLQVPVGGGIIGQVASTNKHMWMSSEDHYREQNLSGSIWDMFLDDYEFRCQFSSGMKTIAVISVEPQGVVQFGSSGKIPERMDFVNQTKRMFQEIVNGGESDVISLTSLNGQNYHQNEAFASLISSEESCFTTGDGSLSRPNSSSFLFDELVDFGIPNELFQTEDFNVSQWFPPLDPINYDGKRESLIISGSDFDLQGNSSDLRDILAPIISQNSSDLHSYSHVDHTALNPKEMLFSKLGIEELLDGVSGISNAGSSSCIEDQASVKRRKTGNSMWGVSQPGLHMVDGYSMSSSSTILHKKQVIPPKPTKKKAKPGTRPRPKDRQLILDRMAELRQLIPNGEKMSIDCLLDRTIKHMVFLQSVTKHADKIKQAEKRKHKGVVSNDSSTNGVTWACEIGNQIMVCPLMVEDLDEHGQMLIEMLCEEEEEGFFLEIVDIIRHFGLIILKGVMEARGGYICAHFVVEPEVNRVVTRQDIFTGLVQFIKTASRVDKGCASSGNSPFEFHQDGVENLVKLADMQFCVNL